MWNELPIETVNQVDKGKFLNDIKSLSTLDLMVSSLSVPRILDSLILHSLLISSASEISSLASKLLNLHLNLTSILLNLTCIIYISYLIKYFI